VTCELAWLVIVDRRYELLDWIDPAFRGHDVELLDFDACRL